MSSSDSLDCSPPLKRKDDNLTTKLRRVTKARLSYPDNSEFKLETFTDQSYCVFPNDGHVTRLESESRQHLSDSHVYRWKSGLDGWANDNCVQGEYCQYGCEPGYIEAQFDLDGSKRGVYCQNTAIRFTASSNSIHEYQNKLCLKTPDSISVVNNTNREIYFCREVYPGSGECKLPTKVAPGQFLYLTTLPTDKTYSSLKYYISRAGEKSLSPVCQFNKVRPSTYDKNSGMASSSLKGIDYYPYVLTIYADGNVNLNSNNDLISGRGGGYDRALGNPGFGIRLYQDQIEDRYFKGGIQYEGQNTTDLLCGGDGCADRLVYPVRYVGQIDKPTFQADCVSMKEGLNVSEISTSRPLIIELYDNRENRITALSDVCDLGVNDVSLSDVLRMEANSALNIADDRRDTTRPVSLADVLGLNATSALNIADDRSDTTRPVSLADVLGMNATSAIDIADDEDVNGNVLGSNTTSRRNPNIDKPENDGFPVTLAKPLTCTRDKNKGLAKNGGDSSSTWWWLVLLGIVLVLILIGVLVYIFSRRDKHPTAVMYTSPLYSPPIHSQPVLSGPAVSIPSPYIQSSNLLNTNGTIQQIKFPTLAGVQR